MTLAITRRSAGNNWHAGRDDPFGTPWTPDVIVIHVTEGDRASVRSWFANDDADVSSAYMVCTDAAVDQFVEEGDTAWHAGRVLLPSAKIVLERRDRRTNSGFVNPNFYSIGIEHEGTGTRDLTAPQFSASVELIRAIATRWGIPITRRHIVGHHEIFAEKSCPGAINVDALVAAASGDAGRLASRPIVVWSRAMADWLIVTRIVSDAEWYFVPMKAVRSVMPIRAGSPLSSMPLTAE